MGFFEDFSRALNNAGKAISEAGAGISNKTQGFAEIAKFETLIQEQERQKKAVYEELGKKYYEIASADENADGRELIARIQAADGKIRVLKDKICALKGTRECPSCHHLNPLEAVYCNQCGAKLTDAAEEEADEDIFAEEDNDVMDADYVTVKTVTAPVTEQNEAGADIADAAPSVPAAEQIIADADAAPSAPAAEQIKADTDAGKTEPASESAETVEPAAEVVDATVKAEEPSYQAAGDHFERAQALEKDLTKSADEAVDKAAHAAEEAVKKAEESAADSVEKAAQFADEAVKKAMQYADEAAEKALQFAEKLRDEAKNRFGN
ncbi:MAG: hypothetical protein IJV14_15765 [Lachnospiraceae bacterium]|nr:hypothetical protein [Lachnospiraceae bacterium]